MGVDEHFGFGQGHRTGAKGPLSLSLSHRVPKPGVTSESVCFQALL